MASTSPTGDNGIHGKTGFFLNPSPGSNGRRPSSTFGPGVERPCDLRRLTVSRCVRFRAVRRNLRVPTDDGQAGRHGLVVMARPYKHRRNPDFAWRKFGRFVGPPRIETCRGFTLSCHPVSIFVRFEQHFGRSRTRRRARRAQPPQGPYRSGRLHSPVRAIHRWRRTVPGLDGRIIYEPAPIIGAWRRGPFSIWSSSETKMGCLWLQSRNCRAVTRRPAT